MILLQNEFINLLVETLDNITPHSFIARFQASYLKQLKNMIGADEVIVLEDFAENFSFLDSGIPLEQESVLTPPCCCLYLFQ